MSDETEIINLLHRYAEFADRGNGDGMAQLFSHTHYSLPPNWEPVYGAEPMAKFYKEVVLLRQDGTPGTQHVVTNPILEIAPDRKTAKCRSYYTVIHQAENQSPRVAAAGRYHDEFEKVDGVWRFSKRQYFMDFNSNIFEKVK